VAERLKASDSKLKFEVLCPKWTHETITITGYTGSGGAVTIPSTTNGLPVTSIGDGAFYDCIRMTNITIPSSVTPIGASAFFYCTSLTAVYFLGNSLPDADSSVFSGGNNATVYYLPGATDWHTPFEGRPAVLWNPQVQTAGASCGVRTNRFGFTITVSSNLVIMVEACTNLTNPLWSAVGTNILTAGSSYFTDPHWTNYHSCFYRLRSS